MRVVVRVRGWRGCGGESDVVFVATLIEGDALRFNSRLLQGR